MSVENAKSIKCVLDIGKVPPEAYRLSTDGRKWLHLCKERQHLAEKMSLYANADGTSIRTSARTLARLLGIKSLHTVNDRIKDLHTLNFLFDTGFDPRYRTIVRRLDVAAIVAAAHEQDSQNGDCSYEQDSPENAAHLSKIGERGEQDSKAPEQDSTDEPANIAHYRLFLPPSQTAPPPPPVNAQPRNGGAGVGFITKNEHIWGLPSTKQREAINALVAEHGNAIVLAALKKFLNRRNGFDGLKNPWRFWEMEGPEYIKLATQEIGQVVARFKDFQRRAAAIDARLAEQARAHEAGFVESSSVINPDWVLADLENELAASAASAEAIAMLGDGTPPAPEPGGIEDFLAD